MFDCVKKVKWGTKQMFDNDDVFVCDKNVTKKKINSELNEMPGVAFFEIKNFVLF